MKIGIKFNPQYPKKDKSNIMVSISYESKRVQLSTGISIPTNKWDFKKSRVKHYFSNAFDINHKLDEIETNIKDFYFKKKTMNEDINKNDIKAIFYDALSVDFNQDMKDKENKAPGMFEYFNLYIDEKQHSGYYTKSAIQKDNSCLNHLKAFSKYKKKVYNWEDMNKQFAEEFLLFLVNKRNLMNSTAKKVVDFLKVFLNKAAENKINTNLSFIKGFIEAKKVLKDNDNNYIIALNEAEFDLLLKYEPPNPRLQKVKDLFLFQIYTGIRVSDLMNIKEGNIDLDNRTIHIYQVKTKEYLSIPIHDKIYDIFKKYPDSQLPKISDQKYNQYIKELCKNAGIDQPVIVQKLYGKKKIEEVKPKWQLISSHTARRTFITLSLKKGVLPEYVMKVSGHKSRKSFEKYVRITQNEAHDAISKAWG